ncbi:NAD(P)-dependent oxidoreductase [uncultured Faecalibaculum sp.]|nr:NAD-dependent epimerase/dehydratase family protein [uncultured Faecalibaculum sp.]
MPLKAAGQPEAAAAERTVSICKKVYIITGADGFLGSNIVRQLQEDGQAEIRALLLPGTSLESLDGLKCSLYYGNVCDKDSMKSLFSGLEDSQVSVIHCAGIVDIKSAYDPNVYYVNVVGTRNIADLTRAASGRLVYISSVHAIPPLPAGEVISPVSHYDPNLVRGLYAKTKAAASELVMGKVRNEGLDAVIIQPSGLIGPWCYGRENLIQFFSLWKSPMKNCRLP